MATLAMVRKYKVEAARALVLARELVAALEDKQTPPDQNPDAPLDHQDVGYMSDFADRLDVLKTSLENSPV